MKRRMMPVLLSAAMVLSLAVPAMTIEPAAASTGKVVIEDVPGGMIRAYTYDSNEKKMFLPVGEEVELPLGEKVYVYDRDTLNYYVDGKEVQTKYSTMELATAANADPYTEGYYYMNPVEVKEGTTFVRAVFEAELVQPIESTYIPKPRIDITYEGAPFLSSSEGAGSVKVKSVTYVSYEADGTRVSTDWPLDEVELQLTSVFYSPVDTNPETKTDITFDNATKTLSWTDELGLGNYTVRFSVIHNGVTYGSGNNDVSVNAGFRVGYQLNIYCDSGQYEYVAKDGSTSTRYLTGNGIVMYIEDLDQSIQSINAEFDNRAGYYHYDHDGWHIMKNGSYVDVAESDKLSTLFSGNSTSATLYAKFVNHETGEPYSYTVKRIDQVDAGEESEKELEEAIAVLDESMEPEDFNNAVSEIMKDLDSNKIGADKKTRLVSALGSKLKDVLGLKLEEKDGVKTTDDSIFVAIGLTSYDDKDTTVTLGLKSNVATSGNASRPGEFMVEVEAGGQTYSKLKVPVEITVTLPADLVASMANASKTYTLKIGGEEIPFVLDESNNTITFTTDTLGRFIITEKTEVEPDPEPEPEPKPDTKPDPEPEPKPDTKPEPEPEPKPDTKPEPEPEKKPDRPSSGSYGTVSGGSGRKTPANRNASGSWVLDARGWWFKYTTGGYPANKWEMVKNKWYYFNADGYMVTGWQLIGNAWYHLDDVNGDMTTGWYQDSTDGKWYYLDANGTMKTGWQLIKGNYYYLSQDTTASTYAFDATTQKWVYSKTKARPYGSMYVNEVTPDGYTVNAGGVWVK